MTRSTTLRLTALSRGVANRYDAAVSFETTITRGVGEVRLTPSSLAGVARAGELIRVDVVSAGEEPMEIQIVAVSAEGLRSTATLFVPTAPVATLTRLLLDGEETQSLTLRQSALRAPLSVTWRLSAEDQYGEALPLTSSTVTETVEASAGAAVATSLTLSADMLSAALTLTITPDADADTVARLLVAAAGVTATARVAVDAVDRVPVGLVLGALQAATLRQSAPDAEVTANFRAALLDNYGDDLGLTTALTLSVVSSDGQRPAAPTSLTLTTGGVEFSVRLTPADGMDTTLTLTASVAEALASTRVTLVARVLAAPPLGVADMLRLADEQGLSQIDLRRDTATATLASTLRLSALARGALNNYARAVEVTATVIAGAARLRVAPANFASLPRDGELIRVEITPLSDEALEIAVVATASSDNLSAQAILRAPRAPARLAELRLDGETALALQRDQEALREPLALSLRLEAFNQYSELFALGVETLRITATATAGAVVSLDVAPAADMLSATLTLTITPDEDRDAQITLTAGVGGVTATATIAVDAVDRRLATIAVRPSEPTLLQMSAHQSLQAEFELRSEDNYGDALPSEVTAMLSVVAQPTLAAPFQLTDFKGDDIDTTSNFEFSDSTTVRVVGIMPAFGVDTTLVLTVTNDIVGVSAGAVFIEAADAPRPTRLTLDDQEMLRLTVDQAAVRQPVRVTMRLRALDQYDMGIAAAAHVTATVSSGASLALSADASTATALVAYALTLGDAGHELVFHVTPDEDADATLLVSVRGEGLAATATVTVDAVDRQLAGIALSPRVSTLTQSLPEDALIAQFDLAVFDNYGDAFVATSDTVRLRTLVSTGTATLTAPASAAAQSALLEIGVADLAGVSFELTLEAALPRENAESLVETATMMVRAAEPRRAASLRLGSDAPVFMLSDLGDVSSPTLGFQVLDQYGDGFGLADGFALRLSVEAVAGSVAVSFAEAPAAIAAGGSTLTMRVALEEAADSRFVVHAAVVVDATTLNASFVFESRVDAAAPAMLTLTPLQTQVAQALPEDAVVLEFDLGLIDTYGRHLNAADYPVMFAVSSSVAVSDATPTLSYDATSERVRVRYATRLLIVGADVAQVWRARLAGVPDATATVTIIAAAPRTLMTLALRADETRLRQTAIGETLATTLTLSGFDQYGAPHSLAGVAAEVAITSGVAAIIDAALSADNLRWTAQLRVTTDEDADALVTPRLSVGAVSATLRISVDALDRAPAHLSLTAVTPVFAQQVFGEPTTATFRLALIDNYGADDVLPAAMVNLTAMSTDGATPILPATFEVPPGGADVVVRVAPLGADTTLTLTASLAGVESVSARARIIAAAPVVGRLLLDGQAALSLNLTQSAVDAPVSVTLTLVAETAEGRRFSLDDYAVDYRIESAASAGAMVEATSSAGAEATLLRVSITPDADADTVASLRVVAGEVSATATIAVDAVDRTPADLRLRAVAATRQQMAPGEAVTLSFEVEALDNYGEVGDFSAAGARIQIEAMSSDGQTPTLGGRRILPAAAAAITATVTPMGGVDAVLTITARLLSADPALSTPTTLASASAEATALAATAPRAATLLLDGQSTLSLAQAAVRAPIARRVTLSLLDQYDAPLGATAARVFGSADAGAALTLPLPATASIAIAPAGYALDIEILPLDDADAVVTLAVVTGGVTLTATIAVDAVDRTAFALSVAAPAETPTQSGLDAEVTATFKVRVVDNYGDDDRLPVLQVTLEASAADGAATRVAPTLDVPPGGADVVVSLTPAAGADTTLTLIARADGLTSGSAETRIQAAAAPRLTTLLLDALPATTLMLDQQILRGEVAVMLDVSALDQYGRALALADGAVEVSATASAGAQLLGLPTRLAMVPAQGLEFGFQVSPAEDADAVVNLRVFAGAASATARIEVDAVDREVEDLELTSVDGGALTQASGEASVTALFELRLLDNYGDDDVLPAMAVALRTMLSDVADVEAPASVSVSGLTTVTVVVTPQGRDLDLTLQAAIGELLEEAMVMIDARETKLLTLDGDAEVSVDEAGVVTFTVTVGALDINHITMINLPGAVSLSADSDADFEILDATAVAAGASTRRLSVAFGSTRVDSVEMSVDVVVTARLRGIGAVDATLRARHARFGDAELTVRIRPEVAALDVNGDDIIAFDDLFVVVRYLGESDRENIPLETLRRNTLISDEQLPILEARIAAFNDPINAGLLDIDGDGFADAYDGRLLIRYFIFGVATADTSINDKVRRLLGL